MAHEKFTSAQQTANRVDLRCWLHSTGLALLAVSSSAMAANPPEAPVVTPTAASAPAALPETEGKFAEVVTDDAPRVHFELGKDGAGVDVATVDGTVVFYRHPGDKVPTLAVDGKKTEFIVVAAVPEDKATNTPAQMLKYTETWAPLGTSSKYYSYKEASLSAPIGDLTKLKGVVLYFGYGVGANLQSRLDYTLSNGAFDSMPLNPLPTLASFDSSVELALPGQLVESKYAMDLSKLEGVTFPATVSGVGGAELAVVSVDKKVGGWAKSVVVQKGEKVKLRGKALVDSGTGVVKWVVNGREEINMSVRTDFYSVSAESLPTSADYDAMNNSGSDGLRQYFYDKAEDLLFPVGASNISVVQTRRSDGATVKLEPSSEKPLKVWVHPVLATYYCNVSYTLNGASVSKKSLSIPSLSPQSLSTAVELNTSSDLRISNPGMSAYTKLKTLAGAIEALGLPSDGIVSARTGSGTTTLRLKGVDVSDPTHEGDAFIFEVVAGSMAGTNEFSLTATNPVKPTSQSNFKISVVVGAKK